MTTPLTTERIAELRAANKCGSMKLMSSPDPENINSEHATDCQQTLEFLFQAAEELARVREALVIIRDWRDVRKQLRDENNIHTVLDALDSITECAERALSPPIQSRRGEMKVWGGLITNYKRASSETHGQVKTIIAAANQREAAKIVGCSLYEFRGWWTETGNVQEIKIAMSKPGVMFQASSSMGNDFEPQDPQP